MQSRVGSLARFPVRSSAGRRRRRRVRGDILRLRCCAGQIRHFANDVEELAENAEYVVLRGGRPEGHVPARHFVPVLDKLFGPLLQICVVRFKCRTPVRTDEIPQCPRALIGFPHRERTKRRRKHSQPRDLLLGDERPPILITQPRRRIAGEVEVALHLPRRIQVWPRRQQAGHIARPPGRGIDLRRTHPRP